MRGALPEAVELFGRLQTPARTHEGLKEGFPRLTVVRQGDRVGFDDSIIAVSAEYLLSCRPRRFAC